VNDLGELILRLGLVAVFIGAAVEGDLTVILVGVLAHLGFFDLPSALGVAALGGFVGDASCYGIGRHRSVAIRGTSIYRRAAPFIERFVRRWGPWQILLARFMYGTRVATMFFWGVQRLSFWRFAGIDLISCALWALVLGGLGFLLSGSAEALLGHVRHVQMIAAVLLVAAIAVFAMLRIFRRRGADGAPPP
jgi:membrane protein DedA with SNARE-associated domain